MICSHLHPYLHPHLQQVWDLSSRKKGGGSARTWQRYAGRVWLLAMFHNVGAAAQQQQGGAPTHSHTRAYRCARLYLRPPLCLDIMRDSWPPFGTACFPACLLLTSILHITILHTAPSCLCTCPLLRYWLGLIDPVELAVHAVSEHPVVGPGLCAVQGPLPHVLFVGSYHVLAGGTGGSRGGREAGWQLRVLYGEGDQFASWTDVDLEAVTWADVPKGGAVP